MGKITRFEFHKLFRQRSFYICSLVTAALLILGVPVLKYAEKKLAMGMGMSGWAYASAVLANSQFTMLLGIFTALFVCDDFSEGTIKNIISRGYSRKRVYVAKYITSLCSMYIMYIFDIIIAFIAGTVVWGAGDVDDTLRTLALQGLILISYHAFFFALAIILGRTGAAIAIGIVATTMISLVLTILDLILKPSKFSFTDIWLDSFLNDAGDPNVKTKTLVIALVGAFLYTVAFHIAGFLFNRRKQV